MKSFNKKEWLGIFSFFIIVSGCFGFIYEFIFYFFDSGRKHWYLQGGNFLPWINIYAIGALFVYFLTYKKRKNPFLVFLLSMLICGILEYSSGAILYHIFHVRYWDYNKEILNFLNIGGFVCLRSILIFGLSSLFFIYVIVPIGFKLGKNKGFLTISTILCAIILLDECYNLVFAKVCNLPRATDIYISLGLRKDS